ncbi:aldo/keto reductase [Liberiplasma polymorphum]|uniref:aldo/keto reductase n=1 Tax=Liberiplasma polymorphum TaxID=3374570 RepID=UPI003774C7BF
MKKKPYMKNGKLVSTLGFGAWPLGNTAHGKTMSISEGVSLVKKALDFGINFFDTAPNYALGRSEIILGKALVDCREKVVINTKFGHHEDDTIDFDENKLHASIEGSLTRLQTTYIDSVILHNPSRDILQGKSNHFKKLDHLKKEGIIKGYGVSIDTIDELEDTLNYLNVDVIELLFNVFAQSTRKYLDEIKKREIALIIKVPLDSGWLSGSYAKDTVFQGIKARWTPEDKLRRDWLCNQLKSIIKNEAITPYALGFLWSYDAITTVIPGIRTMDQLHEHVEASKFVFPNHLKKAFEQFYDDFIKDNPLPW